MELLKRIEINHKVLKGKAVIKGTRLSVQYILGLLANGADFGEILNEYENLQKEDLLACLKFASTILSDQLFYSTIQDTA